MNAPALAIANANGLPGTAGMVVFDSRGERCLLTNHHVVFGGGAGLGDPVWALPTHSEGRELSDFVCLGPTSSGQIGRVTVAGENIFVDCALVELRDEDRFPSWLKESLACLPVARCAPAEPGIPVTKHGATTGLTRGLIVDVCYPDNPFIDGHWWTAPGQILIDSRQKQFNFSASGDSGSAVLDEQGRVVGLLWGTNANGQGISCPIEPVLASLGAALIPTSGHIARAE